MKRFALLVALLLSALSASAATFYVATNGNDAWSGTLSAPNSTNTDGPFRTLPKAQSAMIASSTIKTVTLRNGTYTLAANLSFFSSSNGQTWIPFQNETPVIDGAGLYDLTGNSVSNLTFEGLTFQHMNANLATSVGMGISGDHLTIRWNTFVGCHRYCMVGVVTNSLIDSNHINGQSPGQDAGCSSATYASIQFWPGSTSDTISHNLIENAQGGAIASQVENWTVDRNLIRNVNTNLCDWGAIYVNHSTNVSIRITNNYISGNGGVNFASDQTKSIYLDDLVSNATVSGNICRNCGSDALQIHGGTNNAITNNIFDLSTGVHAMGLYQESAAGDTGMAGNSFHKNLVYTSSCTWPTLWVVSILGGDALPADSNNLYYSTCGTTAPNTGVVDTSPTNANPQFTDAANGDYSMPGTSPAFTVIGFQALPTDQGPLPNPFVSGGQLPSISSFTASPSTIAAGGTSTLAWTTSGATSLSIDQGIGVVTGTSKPVSPASTTIYTLSAANSAGTVTAKTTVIVGTLPVIASFTSSSPIVTGSPLTLSWSVSGATSLSINNGVGTVTGTSVSVTPTATITYVLTATNSVGSVTKSLTLWKLPVISSFAANPSSITSGSASSLSWVTSGATSLSINQGVGTVSGSSSVPVSPPTTTIYTLSATNPGGTTTANATVTVAASVPAIASFIVNPTVLLSGNAATLSWSVTGATSLSIDNGVGTVTGTSVSVSPTSNTTYTLTATNGTGSATNAVSVMVIPAVCH